MFKGVVGSIMAVFLALVVLAGCGGEGGEASLTKDEFVNQATVICNQALGETEKARGNVTKPYHGPEKQREHAEKLVLKVLKPYEAATAKLGELGAVEGQEKQVEALVAAMEEASAKVHANPQSALVNDVPFRNANELATKYGLKSCVIF